MTSSDMKMFIIDPNRLPPLAGEERGPSNAVRWDRRGTADSDFPSPIPIF
jgi:hypothetical protein